MKQRQKKPKKKQNQIKLQTKLNKIKQNNERKKTVKDFNCKNKSGR